MKLPKLDLALQKKACKPAFLGRVWTVGRRALSLEHAPAHQFARCQWQTEQRPALAYLVYRWLLFIGVLSVAIASFACQKLPPRYKGPQVELNYFKWFIYFTNWGFICISLQAALALAVVHRYRTDKNLNYGVVASTGPGTSGKGSKEEEDTAVPTRARTPLLCRGYWLAHVIATDLAFVITLVYWTLIHDPQIHEINALNLLVHGGNSLVMLIELLVTAHPMRFAHALYGAGAGLAYGFFSAFYWALGGTDRVGQRAIYPSLDWNKPASALGFVALCAAVLVSAHALASALAALRSRLASRLPHRLTLPTH